MALFSNILRLSMKHCGLVQMEIYRADCYQIRVIEGKGRK